MKFSAFINPLPASALDPAGRFFPRSFDLLPDTPTKSAARQLTLPQFCECFSLELDETPGPLPWHAVWASLREEPDGRITAPRWRLASQPFERVAFSALPFAAASWFFGFPPNKLCKAVMRGSTLRQSFIGERPSAKVYVWLNVVIAALPSAPSSAACPRPMALPLGA